MNPLIGNGIIRRILKIVGLIVQSSVLGQSSVDRVDIVRTLGVVGVARGVRFLGSIDGLFDFRSVQHSIQIFIAAQYARFYSYFLLNKLE